MSSSNSSGICEDLIDLNKNCSDAEMLAELKQGNHYEERLKWWRDEVRSGNKSVEFIVNLLLDIHHNKKELTQEYLEKVDTQILYIILENSKNYVKQNLEKINSYKERLIKKLDQEQLAKLAIGHLSEGDLKDLYKGLLGEENDHHALCRMGSTMFFKIF